MAYQQYPGSTPGSPAPRSPWSTPPVILAVVAGMVLLVGGVAGALVYTNGNQGDDRAATTSSEPPAAPETVTHTVQAPSTEEPSAAEPPPSSSRTSAGPIAVDGADRQGFDAPHCNADDDAVFIGRTSRSRVVVCQVGSQTGRLYYKGWANGKEIEVGFPQRRGDTFIATATSTTYTVSPTALLIHINGKLEANEPMLQSWVD